MDESGGSTTDTLLFFTDKQIQGLEAPIYLLVTQALFWLLTPGS